MMNPKSFNHMKKTKNLFNVMEIGSIYLHTVVDHIIEQCTDFFAFLFLLQNYGKFGSVCNCVH